ncbi:MAG TPA: GntR family transcriptional regulator [Xanthobacteraceae bacterium]|nr:GntR family transcriptional regulator [Xanthobacteraceae bacterium]
MIRNVSNSDLGRAGIVYRELKRRITELHYKPGEKLSEIRIASELGFGRSPIRTALSRLQSEGWIEVSPQSGTFIRGLSDDEIREILESRLVLEPYLAGLAAKRASDAELGRMREIFTAFGDRVSRDRLDEYLDLDLHFHMSVYEAARNKLIADFLINLIDKVRWIRRGSIDSLARIQGAYKEIRFVLDAMESRDARAASAAMRTHIANTLEFRKHKQKFPLASAG